MYFGHRYRLEDNVVIFWYGKFVRGIITQIVNKTVIVMPFNNGNNGTQLKHINTEDAEQDPEMWVTTCNVHLTLFRPTSAANEFEVNTLYFVIGEMYWIENVGKCLVSCNEYNMVSFKEIQSGNTIILSGKRLIDVLNTFKYRKPITTTTIELIEEKEEEEQPPTSIREVECKECTRLVNHECADCFYEDKIRGIWNTNHRRVAVLEKKQSYQGKKRKRVNQSFFWYEGRILEIDFSQGRGIKIHWQGFDDEYDEWIKDYKNRISPFLDLHFKPREGAQDYDIEPLEDCSDFYSQDKLDWLILSVQHTLNAVTPESVKCYHCKNRLTTEDQQHANTSSMCEETRNHCLACCVFTVSEPEQQEQEEEKKVAVISEVQRVQTGCNECRTHPHVTLKSTEAKKEWELCKACTARIMPISTDVSVLAQTIFHSDLPEENSRLRVDEIITSLSHKRVKQILPYGYLTEDIVVPNEQEVLLFSDAPGTTLNGNKYRYSHFYSTEKRVSRTKIITDLINFGPLLVFTIQFEKDIKRQDILNSGAETKDELEAHLNDKIRTATVMLTHAGDLIDHFGYITVNEILEDNSLKFMRINTRGIRWVIQGGCKYIAN